MPISTIDVGADGTCTTLHCGRTYNVHKGKKGGAYILLKGKNKTYIRGTKIFKMKYKNDTYTVQDGAKGGKYIDVGYERKYLKSMFGVVKTIYKI